MATPEYIPEPALVEVRVTEFAALLPPRRLPPRPVDAATPGSSGAR